MEGKYFTVGRQMKVYRVEFGVSPGDALVFGLAIFRASKWHYVFPGTSTDFYLRKCVEIW